MTQVLSIRHRLALEIARKLQDKVIEEHPLKQLFWECTLRCNLQCRHCGSDCKKQSSYPDMPKEDFLRVLDSIRKKRDPHSIFVIITGGEPLVRSDLEDCGRSIYEKGFPWGIVTNGLAFTEQRFRHLLQAGIHSITVSLDGLEDSHNWIRNNESSFKRASDAIQILASSDDIKFDVVTCVNSRNYSQLQELKSYLIEKKVKHWRLFTIFPVGRAASDRQLQLTNEEFRGLLSFIKQTRKEKVIEASYGCEGFLGNYEGEVRNHFFACQAGVTVGSVLINGAISACPSIRSDYHQGNIYNNDFLDVWEKEFKPYRDRTWMHKGSCGSCNYFKFCRGNGMHLRDENGDLLFCHLKRITEI